MTVQNDKFHLLLIGNNILWTVIETHMSWMEITSSTLCLFEYKTCIKHTCPTKEGLISIYTIEIIYGIVFSELFRIVEDDIYDSYIHNSLLLNFFLFDNPLYEKDNIIIDTKHAMF